jgi:hypothetical protein
VAVAAAPGALLLGAVDGHLRGVQIDRHRRTDVAAQRPVKTLAGPGHRPLDALDVTTPN